MGIFDWFDRLRRRFPGAGPSRDLTGDPRLLRIYQRHLGTDPRRILRQLIAQTRFVVIDTETTGFKAYGGDEIVSICLLELDGLEPTGRRLESYINPERAIPPTSTRVHGITDADVRQAPRIEELFADIFEFIEDSVLVGHHINFDLRFLNRTLNTVLGCKLKNPWLDTMLLYLGHSGRIGHYSLEEVARYCRVPVTGRHSAHGDAVTAAEIFRVLARRLSGPDQPVRHLLRQQVDTRDP